MERNKRAVKDWSEMSYLRGGCGLIRWKGASKESMYEMCGMGYNANGVKCGVME